MIFFGFFRWILSMFKIFMLGSRYRERPACLPRTRHLPFLFRAAPLARPQLYIKDIVVRGVCRKRIAAAASVQSFVHCVFRILALSSLRITKSFGS